MTVQDKPDDFFMLHPIRLTAASLHSTTAPEPTPAWATGRAYDKDVVVLHPSTKDGLQHLWVSLVAANTAVPGSDKLKWADGGAGNRHACLDAYSGTQTQQLDGPLVIELLPGAVTTTLAIFNLSGHSVRVQMINTLGDVIYDETKSLIYRRTSSWSEYFFAGFAERLTQLVFEGLPFAVSAKLRITVTGQGALGVGRIVGGRMQSLGCLGYDCSPFLSDYSQKKWDPDFGDYEWQVRDFARGLRGTIEVKKPRLNRVWTTLIASRSMPTLFVGSIDPDYSETLVMLGVMTDMPLSIPYPTHSLLNFTIEGLT